MKTIFEAKGLGFKYQIAKKPAIKNLTFTIKAGDFIGVVGGNGAGKTTLCNILRRIIPDHINGTYRGTLLLDDRLIAEYSNLELSRKVGLVFQNPFLQISGIKQTVFEEIAFGLENLGVERLEMIERVNAAIETFKIKHIADKNPTQLSGGQCQRVAIAAVFVMNPEVIILDEPTSQLDPVGTEEVFAALDILKQQHKTVILVEHKIDLISEYANRIFVLHRGEMVMQGATAEVLSDAKIKEYSVQQPNVTRAALEVSASLGLKNVILPSNMQDGMVFFSEVKNEQH